MAKKSICSCMAQYHNSLYVLMRVVVGILFAQHGAQKLFGWLGGGGIAGTTGFFESMGIPLAPTAAVIVGSVEFFGGIAIAVGLFTRLMASLAAVDVIVAYLVAHMPNGIWPLLNKGELALLFAVVFIFLTTHGNGKWSLEKALLKKEVF